MSQSPPTSHPVGVLHQIRWSEICPWLILLRSLRVSLSLRVLCLAGVGLLLTQLGWSFCDRLLAPPAMLDIAESQPTPAEVPDGRDQPSRLLPWTWLQQPVLLAARRACSGRSAAALVACAAWALVVWAYFGSVMARICAMQLTRHETISLRSALQTATDVWPATATAPLIVVAGAAVLCLPLLLAGALLRAGVLAWLPSLAWVVVLLWGLVLTIVLTGLLIGWPLMWSTLAVERSDAFDAVSRTYAYVYQRPLHLLFYLVVASILGAVGLTVVTWFVVSAQQLTAGIVGWAAGGDQAIALQPASMAENPALLLRTQVILLWQHIWLTLVAAYPIGYLWSAAVGIYLLLRRDVDATEMEEIRLATAESQQGLPTLVTNQEGLPEVQQES